MKATTEQQMDTATRFRELADRIQKNGNVTWAELGEVLASADREMIDAIEATLAAKGEYPLPPHINPGSPEFQAAAAKARQFRNADIDVEDPEYRAAFLSMVRLAPPWMKKEFDRIADEMELLPKPDYMSENGEPLFSAACIAQRFGKTEAEVIADIHRLGAGDFSTGPAFRIQ